MKRTVTVNDRFQRGYRYVWLDAGHLGQNLYLVATALGLGPVGVGGFFDAELSRLLDLQAGEEALYLVGVGRPACVAMRVGRVAGVEAPGGS